MFQSFLFYGMKNVKIVPMKDYKTTHQVYIYLFFKKVVSKVAPKKVENTKMLSDGERKEVVRRIQKKYNLSEKQILKYLDMNISCPNVLKMFLEVEEHENKHEENRTKRCAKPAFLYHLYLFLLFLFPLVFFNVVIGIWAHHLTGFIVMASLDALLIPLVVFQLVRLLKIHLFLKDDNLSITEYKQITILNYHAGFGFLLRIPRTLTRLDFARSLLYLILDCEINGEKKKIWCFTYDMISTFPVKTPFYFIKIRKALSKSLKGKVVSGKCFLKHNVLVDNNNKMRHIINNLFTKMYDN